MIFIGMTMMVSSANAESAASVPAVSAAAEQAAAVEQTQAKQSFSQQGSSYLVQLLSGMAIVVLCIIVLAWFARKMNRFQTSADGSLQIIGGVSMGARERIVLVQVGEQQLLLGVAPGQINTLHVLEHGVEASADKAGASFGQHLVSRMQAAVTEGGRGQQS